MGRRPVGPYARLRPGAELARAQGRQFRRDQKAVLGPGAKASHLTYIGDARVGAGANIGAGTITCNYDGYFKYETVIGARRLHRIEQRAGGAGEDRRRRDVGAGSVVTGDVEAGALGLARAKQEVKPGWARRFREVMAAKKTAK